MTRKEKARIVIYAGINNDPRYLKFMGLMVLRTGLPINVIKAKIREMAT